MRLTEYEWPGNVRELKNVLDRAVSLLPPPVEGEPADRRVGPELLGLPTVTLAGAVPAPSDGPDSFKAAKERMIAAWERAYVARLLAASGGNVSRAARAGGLDRVHLHRLIRKHGIDLRGA